MPHGKVRHLAVVTALTASLIGAVAAPAVAATSTPALPHSAAATPSASLGTMTSTVDGTFTDATGNPGTVHGTFTPTSFSQQGDQVLATGTLVATMADSTGKQVGTATQTVTLPLQRPAQAINAAASCQILNLVLGPLNLNLLGLVVHLNQVHLNITAVPGAGNLLGNLLCAVAGLLDGPGALSQLVADLNSILGLLGG